MQMLEQCKRDLPAAWLERLTGCEAAWIFLLTRTRVGQGRSRRRLRSNLCRHRLRHHPSTNPRRLPTRPSCAGFVELHNNRNILLTITSLDVTRSKWLTQVRQEFRAELANHGRRALRKTDNKLKRHLSPRVQRFSVAKHLQRNGIITSVLQYQAIRSTVMVRKGVPSCRTQRDVRLEVARTLEQLRQDRSDS